jgi:hypothetical protein
MNTITNRQDKIQDEFIRKQVRRLPEEFRPKVLDSHKARYREAFDRATGNWLDRECQAQRAANSWLLEVCQEDVPACVTWSDAKVCEEAKRLEELYRETVRPGAETKHPHDEKRADANELTTVAGFQIPGETRQSRHARITDKFFWQRQIRKRVRREREKLAHKFRIIGKYGEHYVSNLGVIERHQQLERHKAFLDRYGVTDGKQTIPLRELFVTGENRMAEVYVRCLGQQAVAEERGLKALFFTFTAPSEYHPNPVSKSGTWDGKLTPLDSHQLISKQWKLLLDNLKTHEIEVFGLRTTEPHLDGCTHWHGVLYCAGEEIEFITERIEEYLGESPRTRVITCDERSKPASYALKYVMKSLALPAKQREEVREALGEDRLTDEDDHELSDAEAKRVDAWRATWGIRAYQFFGDKSRVSVWRELRKLEQCPQYEIVEIWQATRENRYDKFIKIGASIKILREETINRYGDQGIRTVGLRLPDGTELRRKQWQIVPLEEEQEVIHSYPSKTKRKPDKKHRLTRTTKQERREVPKWIWHIRILRMICLIILLKDTDEFYETVIAKDREEWNTTMGFSRGMYRH